MKDLHNLYIHIHRHNLIYYLHIGIEACQENNGSGHNKPKDSNRKLVIYAKERDKKIS